MIQRLGGFILVLSMLASACGASGSTLVSTQESTPPNATDDVAVPSAEPLSSDPGSPAGPSDPTRAADVTTGRFVGSFSLQESKGRSAVPFRFASSDNLADLLNGDDGDIIGEIPFGVSPGYGRMQVWSDDGTLASQPRPHVVWPASCLGPSPDIDADGLKDDCDPYPWDGPIADLDGDGVSNLIDNCPTIPNPDQVNLFDRSMGTACDTREGVSIWEQLIEPVTLDAWNQTRAERGLAPIVMPAAAEPSPAVVEWCTALARGEYDFETTDFDEAVALFSAIPADFALSADDIRTFAELVVAGAESAQAGQADELNSEVMELTERLRSFFVLIDHSDQACPRGVDE